MLTRVHTTLTLLNSMRERSNSKDPPILVKLLACSTVALAYRQSSENSVELSTNFFRTYCFTVFSDHVIIIV